MAAVSDRAPIAAAPAAGNGPNLEADSAAFRGTGTHRASPWFRVPLRLNTVAEAVERYRVWAEAQWDATHPNRVVQYQKPDGSVGEREVKNPYAAKASAKA